MEPNVRGSLCKAAIFLKHATSLTGLKLIALKHCREDKNRDLYCYTNANSWYHTQWDSMPVDCATYNSTELKEIEFVCYAITITDFGVGLAAAGALAKLSTVITTIYI